MKTNFWQTIQRLLTRPTTKQLRTVTRRLDEQEDVDAYNTDDGQPPFEEKDPRQRTKTPPSPH